MKIDTALLDSLTDLAKDSPRLRASYDLRTTLDDTSQRILNALEPGTVVPIHRHSTTSETVICIRGCVREVFFDESGAEVESVTMAPGTDCMMVQVEAGRWHTAESLASGSVICEVKDGPYVVGCQEVFDKNSR